MSAPAAALEFLACPTPDAWLRQAEANLDLLLIDHANCEKKAAGTAISLMYRYVDRPELLRVLSRLAREELRHFEQVHGWLERLGIEYRHLSAGRYAAALRGLARTWEPARLEDVLLTGALVEARSCERFTRLAEVLPAGLGEFYRRLAVSEARHFERYLTLAERYGAASVAERLPALRAREAELVTARDTEFRFHSGPLAENTRATAR